jgi:DNA-binding protein H-NS
MAKPNGIDDMSYKVLVDLKQRVAVAILERKAAEKTEIKRKMAELAAASGFDLSELMGGKTSRKGAKVEVKYRNPADLTQTWTGRGRQPRWLVAALKKGQKLESFAV